VLSPAFDPYTITQCLSNNDLREKNVDTFALEVPYSCFGTPDGVINIWAITRRLFHNNNDTLGSSHIPGVQTSRMGNALVNELVIGLVDKVRFNRQSPRLDKNGTIGFGDYVLNPTLPRIISNRFLAAVNQVLNPSPPFASLEPILPRFDLFTIFLTGLPTINKGGGGFIGEVLRLNVSIPPTAYGSQNPLGIVGGFIAGQGNVDLAGYPNGRRPGDDIVDISLVVFMGVVCTQPFINAGLNLCPQNNNTPLATAIPIGGIVLRDGSPVQDTYFKNTFPYFNTPVPGSYLDGGVGNVVQNPTLCYPMSQHGRCPFCASCPNVTCHGSGAVLIPLSLLTLLATIALSLLFM